MLSPSQDSTYSGNSAFETDDSDDENNSGSRYCTFTKSERKSILKKTRTFVSKIANLDSKSLQNFNWVAFLEKLNENKFIAFIKQEIPAYVKLLPYLELIFIIDIKSRFKRQKSTITIS